MAKNQTVNDDEGWEEKGQDNGDLISWKQGEKHQGVFLGIYSVVLPISDQNPDIGDGTGGTADMAVFENATGKWSTWLTYQLREAFENIAPGEECRIECMGERKAKVGNVKIFSVKTRTPVAPVVRQDGVPF